MRQLICAGILTFCVLPAFAQAGKKLHVGNSLATFSVEISGMAHNTNNIKTDGLVGEYYSRNNYDGVRHTQFANRTLGAVGCRLEFFFTPNDRRASLGVGLDYMGHGGELMRNSNTDWIYYGSPQDTTVAVVLRSLRMPLTLNVYLPFGARRQGALGFFAGTSFRYLLSASFKDLTKEPGGKYSGNSIDASDMLNRFYWWALYGGVRLKYGRVYAHANISFASVSKLFTSSYYGAEKYESNISVEQAPMFLGVGFYVKK